MTKVILMPNKKIGLNITKFLIDSGDVITTLFLTEENKEYNNQIKKIANIPEENIFLGVKLHNDVDIVKKLPPFDFIVSVYWPYLISNHLLGLAKESVNFHPALLPINRGWYPHVHSLIDGSPFGVTLHSIDNNADTGPIWVQKEIKVDVCMDAGTIHSLLQEEIENLFKENWEKISSGSLKPFKQDDSKSIYHSKKEIEHFDEIKINDQTTALDLINLLRARSFGSRSFAYFKHEGEKIYLKLKLSRNDSFDGQ